MSRYVLGADETGAVVLHVVGNDDTPAPVSQQNGNWSEWVEFCDWCGREPGEFIPVAPEGE